MQGEGVGEKGVVKSVSSKLMKLFNSIRMATLPSGAEA